jgi:hypothetical protein
VQGGQARRPGLARGVWLALVALTLAIFSASLPGYWAQLRTVCIGSSSPGADGAGGVGCSYVQLSPQQVAMLHGWGISPSAYAASMLALALAMLAACLAVGALIAWRRPDDRMALLVAHMLVTVGAVSVVASVPATSPMRVANVCLLFLTSALFILVFSLFPSGHFVPRWTRWLALVSLVAQAPAAFFPTAPFTSNFHAGDLAWLALQGGAAILVAIQVYRYRRVSSPLERQQTKTVVLGLAVPGTVYVGGTLLYLLLPTLAAPGSPYGAPYRLALTTVGNGVLLLVPLAFGVAMLRYRLWDVDVLIRRTLVYGTLTLTLTALYVGLVIGLQALLGRLLGSSGLIRQENTLAVVLSTLAIAALFQPLRRRLRRTIDRRFYRRTYDAARTLEAFSATLRNEVDREQIRELLMAVIQQTMQPAHVSLWLRPPERRSTEQAHRLQPLGPTPTKLSSDYAQAQPETKTLGPVR